MEIDLNKEADSETTEFENFSIRAYVAEIRERDPEKCWPFESLCSYKDFNCQDILALASELPESRSLSSQNIPEDCKASDDTPERTEAPEVSEVEISEGKETQSETPTAFEVEISKGNEAGFETPTAFDVESTKVNEAGSDTLTAFEVEISKGNEGGSEAPTSMDSNEKTLDMEADLVSEAEISMGKDVGSETPIAFEVEISKRNEVGSETPTEMIASRELDNDISKTLSDGSAESLNEAQSQNEESVDEGAKIESSVAADTADPGRHSTRRKKRKFRLLSDILRDLAGPSGEFYVRYDEANADNVNSKFTVDIEDEADGVTLDASLRKQKGVEVASRGGCALKQKQKTVQVDEPRLDEVTSLNCGPEGSDLTMKKRKKSSADAHNKFTSKKLEQALHSVQWEVAAAKRKSSGIPIIGTRGRIDSLVPPASVYLVRRPLVEVKGAGVAWAMPKGCGVLVCSMNRNPADFSIPNAENKFMRGY